MKPIAGEGQFPFNGDGFCITGAKINGVTYEGGFNIHQQRSDCVFDLINRSTKEIVTYVQMVAHDQYAQVLSTSIPTATLVGTIPNNSFFIKTVRTDGGKDSFVTAFQNNLIKLISGERIYKPWPLIECAGGDDIEDYEFHVEPAVHGWVGDEMHIRVRTKLSQLHVPGHFTYDDAKVSVLELLEHALKLKRSDGGYHKITFKPKDGREAISLDITNYVEKADRLVAVMFDNECSHNVQVYGSRSIKKEEPLYIQLESVPEWFAPREPIMPDDYEQTQRYDGYPRFLRSSEDNKTYVFQVDRSDDDSVMGSGTISYSNLDGYLTDPTDYEIESSTLNKSGNYGVLLHHAGDSYIRIPNYSICVVKDISTLVNQSYPLSGPMRLGEELQLCWSAMYIIDGEQYHPTAPDKSLWRWRSSDPSVASIDNNGKVTSHKEGQTKIDFYFEGYPELTYVPDFSSGVGTQILTVKADAPLTAEWTPEEPYRPISTDASGGTKIDIKLIPNGIDIPAGPSRYPTSYNDVHYDESTQVAWFGRKSTGLYPNTLTLQPEVSPGYFPAEPYFGKGYYAEYDIPRPNTEEIFLTLPYTIPVFGRGIDVLPVGIEFTLQLYHYDGLECEFIDPDNILTVYDMPYYQKHYRENGSTDLMCIPHSEGTFQIRVKYPYNNLDETYTIKVLPVPKI